MRDLIYKIRAGADLYNLTTKNSDIDIRGVFNVPIKPYICGNFKEKIVTNNEQEDSVYMEVVTYLKLLCGGNPNVVDWLYGKIITYDSSMDYILANKKIFLTKEFVKKSLFMATSMLLRCKKKEEKQWKMLSHAKRILYIISTFVLHGIYDPRMKGMERYTVLEIKNGKGDYWKLISEIEQGLHHYQGEIKTLEIPDKVPKRQLDKLILSFKGL